jgi:predicted nucleic acid-binding Zn ribbon protein
MTRKYQQSGDDPVDGVEGVRPISESVARLARQLGLGDSLGLSAVFGRWDEVVGAVLAAHTKPERLRDGELVIIVDESSWATEVRFMTDTIIEKCNREAGRIMVDRVIVRVESFARSRADGSGEGAAGTAWNVGRNPRNDRPD